MSWRKRKSGWTSSRRSQIQGKRLVLSNIAKVLDPKAGFPRDRSSITTWRFAPVPASAPARDRDPDVKRGTRRRGIDPLLYAENCPSPPAAWVGVKTAPIGSIRTDAPAFRLGQDSPRVGVQPEDMEIASPLASRGRDLIRRTAWLCDFSDHGDPADLVDLLRGGESSCATVRAPRRRASPRRQGPRGSSSTLPLKQPPPTRRLKPFARDGGGNRSRRRKEAALWGPTEEVAAGRKGVGGLEQERSAQKTTVAYARCAHRASPPSQHRR